MKRKSCLFIVLFSLIHVNGCGIFDGLFKELLRPQFVLLTNHIVLVPFENNIACYYYQNNKFPTNISDLRFYTDSVKVKHQIFSKLEIDTAATAPLKCNFEIFPMMIPLQWKSEFVVCDSIQIINCTGSISLNDSLISESYDSLLVEINFVSVEAIAYENGESRFYDSTDVVINSMIKNPSKCKISIRNSCREQIIPEQKLKETSE